MRENGRFIFTDETALAMRIKYEAGATLQTLVDEYGTNRKTISNTIRRVGGTMRPAGLPKLTLTQRILKLKDDGYTNAQIAEHLDLTKTEVQKLIAPRNAKCTCTYI